MAPLGQSGAGYWVHPLTDLRPPEVMYRCLDSRLSPFPVDGPCYRFNRSEFLDSISAAATRGRRRPRAGAWETSRLPGVLGRLGPGQAWLNDRECSEGETHPEKSYRPTSGAAPSLSPQPTGGPARPPRTPASSVRTSVLPSFLSWTITAIR